MGRPQSLALWDITIWRFGMGHPQIMALWNINLCCVVLCVLTVSLLEVGRGIGAPAVVPSSRFARVEHCPCYDSFSCLRGV